MKMSSLVKSSLFVFILGVSYDTSAIDLKMPGMPGKNADAGSNKENAEELLKNARNSIALFVQSKSDLVIAMGGASLLESKKNELAGLKQGDAAVSKADLETMVSLDAALNEMIAQKTAENSALDAKNKAAAGKAMTNYVMALVSVKKLVGSIQGVSKNPMSAGKNIGSLAYLAKELPGVVSSGADTTKALFTYMNAKGVDTKNAKNAAAELGM